MLVRLCVCVECMGLFMYCDRPHSFRSIFIQSSRLTVDPLLIYFITPLRLSGCACVCIGGIHSTFLSPHRQTVQHVRLCLCVAPLYLRTGRGRRIVCLLRQTLLACLLQPVLVENCSPSAANDAKCSS